MSGPTASLPPSTPRAFTRWQFVRLLAGLPFYIMVGLVFVEAALSAFVTYLVIQVGRDIVNDVFMLRDFLWILLAQISSYFLHTVSWIFGEQAGFRAFARYLLLFARDNRHQATLLNAKDSREAVEPFLTNETFHLIFEAMYEFEGTLQLLFGLLLNVLVIGHEIDNDFPLAYGLVFIIVMTIQWLVRRPLALANLNNQRFTNRVTAHTYTAWDNIFAGNRHNFRLWHRVLGTRLREALRAQIHAIVMREGLSSASGVIGLVTIFSTMALVIGREGAEASLLVAMAATLPKQISLTHEVHSLALGWNDLLALWTRVGGVVDHMHPAAPAQFDERIRFERLTLRQGDTVINCSSLDDALAVVRMQPTGRIQVRGGNGAGKSSLLAALKQSLRGQAYYWPTNDRLAFEFAGGGARTPEGDELEAETEAESEALLNASPGVPAENPSEARSQARAEAARFESASGAATASAGFSSGERQLHSLAEIVRATSSPIYLFDEWDANLDADHRARAQALVDALSRRARVVEISHRD